jgi:mannosyl-3-phosphoglycerate phosphatase
VREQLQIRLRGFHEITPEELAEKSGLPIHLSALALDREYDEPFWIEGNGSVESIECAFRNQSLHVTRGGRFHHVTGNNDKGKAVDVLKARFSRHFTNPVFAGIGDSPNDIPMLQRVDIPILVQTHSGSYDDATRHAAPGVRLADGIGPHGWSAAVDVLLSEWRS